PWQIFPAMAVNRDFVGQMAEAGLTPSHKLYFLCRSGVRSLAAAAAAEAAGYSAVFNVLDGFEGPPDGGGHRGRVAGWKADGLAWRQR
ncbi:MAG: rhodanese-like domain-containing protein, partial [Acetobacteraceae bacterium]|nr:rhodanese-like domain-containing protein [Acetobacteraceae bacterium]